MFLVAYIYTLLFFFFMILVIYLLISSHISNRTKPNKKYPNDMTNIIYRYSNSNTYVVKRYYMSYPEYIFYKKMLSLEKELNIRIVPQVNLATVISKTSDRYHNELFRNIDFGIFDACYKNVLLLIEFNDKSHKYPDRMIRDKSVRNICETAGIKLITFYTDKSNTEESIHDTIRKELNKITTPLS